MTEPVLRPFPDVWHLRDELGVCMTLLVGQRRALLVDAGYGLTSALDRARRYTALPLTLLLTHGHHDHALGAMAFSEVYLSPADWAEYRLLTGCEKRQTILRQAEQLGCAPADPARYLSAAMPEPLPLVPGSIDLGGLHAQVLPCPGHTPGSVALYVPEHRLLLTGDAWNPITWVFFPSSLPVETWRENLRGLLALPFTQVLCPHRATIFPRAVLERFLSAVTDAALQAAPLCPVPPYEAIATRRLALPEGELIFDGGKSALLGQ